MSLFARLAEWVAFDTQQPDYDFRIEVTALTAYISVRTN
jgi:hypothetical protein